MKLHEYQAKALFKEYDIPLSKGAVVRDVNNVAEVFSSLTASTVVVKAQVHAGGRGKAGGIKLVKNQDDAFKETKRLLGSRLVTHQTTKDGQPINAVYLEAASDISHEYYLALLFDRSKKRLCIMFSTQGGMDIEEVAANHPSALLKFFVPLGEHCPKYVARQISAEAKWKKDIAKQASTLIETLYRIYIERDCTLVEINPLVLTKDGTLMPLDAKVVIDDNAAFRQTTLAEQVDDSQENEAEVEANEIGLNYISLDGNIACMVNGAGLAMATMDLIKLHGGEPANFLDVGGGANAEQIKKAFQIILRDDRVQSVLVNIFGGIMRCDVIAQGIIDATQELKPKVSVVVRLEGTNVEKGKKMLQDSGLTLISANSLDEAASVSVEKARG